METGKANTAPCCTFWLLSAAATVATNDNSRKLLNNKTLVAQVDS